MAKWVYWVKVIKIRLDFKIYFLKSVFELKENRQIDER
jgi:hypothetical protein